LQAIQPLNEAESTEEQCTTKGHAQRHAQWQTHERVASRGCCSFGERFSYWAH